jgi:hypothetical protein
LRLDPIPTRIRARGVLARSGFTGARGRSCASGDRHAQRRATARNVPPGTHSIEIVERSLSQIASDVVQRRIEDIEVAPSTHLRVPRLLGIDLRGVLRPHHLTVVDDAGHALAGVVELSNEGDAEHPDEVYFDQICFERGRADFLTAKGDGLQAPILVDRFRPQHLDLGTEQSRVVMPRGVPIHIVLAPGFDLPAEFASKGRLHIVHVGDDGQKSTIDRPSLETTIVVQDRTDDQTFVSTPDRDCWNSAVRTL